MFFVVDSSNRHAVRRVLNKAGMDSAEVRNMRNGQLGKALYDAVSDGKLTEAEASEACKQAITEPVEQEPTEIAGSYGEIRATAPDAAQQLGALIAQLAGKPSLDPETVRKMVADAIAQERIKPAILEIRCGDLVTRVDGESTHSQFE